jgi:periplasmic divalent cation tolerance protein
MPNSQYQLILCTCPEGEIAEQLATMLVTQHLAACINIMPGLTSVYRWQGNVEKENEVLLLIKTTRERYAALQTAIQQHHPYELPEVLAVTVDDGSPEYLRWLASSLENKP